MPRGCFGVQGQTGGRREGFLEEASWQLDLAGRQHRGVGGGRHRWLRSGHHGRRGWSGRSWHCRSRGGAEVDGAGNVGTAAVVPAGPCSRGPPAPSPLPDVRGCRLGSLPHRGEGLPRRRQQPQLRRGDANAERLLRHQLRHLRAERHRTDVRQVPGDPDLQVPPGGPRLAGRAGVAVPGLSAVAARTDSCPRPSDG